MIVSRRQWTSTDCRKCLRRIECGEIRCIARDLPEPSPLAAEILNARPYAFLDNAPLEERRTQAVYTRRASERNGSDGLGILDAAAIEKVKTEAWPEATNPDELHDALMLIGAMLPEEIERSARNGAAEQFISTLVAENRATRILVFLEHGDPATKTFCIAAERLPMLRAMYPNAACQPELVLPDSMLGKTWERTDAIRELIRCRMEVCGPITVSELADTLVLQPPEIDAALLALEAEGFVLRGKFHPDVAEQEWCDRRLLARIHRLTVDRLRAEIQPVSVQDFYRFLFAWQRADQEHRTEGLEGLQSVLEQLDGCELPLAAWESAVLPARVADYDPEWLDRLCFSGRVGWGRLSIPQNPNGRAPAPLRTSPIALYLRENLTDWLALTLPNSVTEVSVNSQGVFEALQTGGALFFSELVNRSGLLPSQVEEALSQLAALGLVTSDSFDGLRALLVPSNKRPTFGRILQNVGAKQTLPASNLQVAGHCCRGTVSFQPPSARQTAQAHVKRRLKNSHGYCCAVTALSSADCSNERVSPLRGTSWAAFIDEGKHAEKSAAVISLAE